MNTNNAKRPSNPTSRLRLVTDQESFNQFRLLVHHHIPDSYANHGGKIQLDRSERQRYECPDHGTVVPMAGRYEYRCPYCLPVGEDDSNYVSYTVTIGGQVVLNPS